MCKAPPSYPVRRFCNRCWKPARRRATRSGNCGISVGCTRCRRAWRWFPNGKPRIRGCCCNCKPAWSQIPAGSRHRPIAPVPPPFGSLPPALHRPRKPPDSIPMPCNDVVAALGRKRRSTTWWMAAMWFMGRCIAPLSNCGPAPLRPWAS